MRSNNGIGAVCSICTSFVFDAKVEELELGALNCLYWLYAIFS